ncbi:BOR1 (YNL275W) [Zygosaccharomyces parabailii]|nr:BOR1 (YNL275W) [Zygosaccharomyces parabailii]CDH09779.1 probable Boron transporter 1 [Zygosaccharomyces bailii ISA1307]
MPYPDSGHSGDIEEVDTHRISDELNTQSHQEREPSGMARRRRRIPPPGIGIWLDIKDKIPLYWSDWTDSWDYRVVPAVLDTYFSNLLPALAFAQDMFDRTDHAYGVNEVLLSSAMAGIVFGVLGGQPLCIVGVTGPISILNYTIYDIVKNWSTNYFGFMFWVCIWSMILHFILAVSNAVALLQYVTTFPCDIFGLFINVVYIQKGIQVLSRQFNSTERGKDVEGGFASVVASLVMVIFGLMFKNFNQTPFLNHTIRTFISDYSTPLSVLFWSAFTHFGGYLDVIHFQKLPITQSFHPTSSTRRNKSTWLAYHSTSAHDVFIALPFGIILTLLFYFDHNVSSLMAQKHQYKLRKPASFHYDFALLGVTTGIAGVLGIPAPNGLIPQAPMHTEALLVRDIDGNVVRCVEQRFTNTVQGLMMIGTMTRPLLVCLGQIPQAILAGLFFTMGIQGLLGNVILRRIFWLFTEDRLKDAASPLQKVSVKWLVLFLCFSLAGFAGEFAITNTIAAILFPIVLLLTVVACLLFPYIFPKDQLALLEQNVAQEFTLKNLLWDTLCGMQDVADSSISSASSSTVREDSMRAM